MRNLIVICLCILTFFKSPAQMCDSGDPSGNPGGGTNPNGTGFGLPIFNSFDPNDIVPPAAIGRQGWVRRDAVLPFMIRCENHKDSATAPVQEAWVYLPFDAKMDSSRFELGDIGFGAFYISMPTNTKQFSTVIDARATLRVKVSIEAGIQRAQNRAYWHFRALDTLTNDLPADPFIGFLPVNDSTHRGEGFAHFSIQAKATSQTFDRLQTQASIIFDQNPAIATPAIFNTVDADAPKSKVLTSFSSPTPNQLRVQWTGTDVGCGIETYTIFVSTNDSAYIPWKINTSEMEGLLSAKIGNRYRFKSVARDSVGNIETADSTTSVLFTSIKPIQPDATTSFFMSLSPNPFSYETSIVYHIGNSGKCRITVLNMDGRVVKTLIDKYHTAGDYTFKWDGQDLSNSVYLLQLVTTEGIDIGKVVFMR